MISSADIAIVLILAALLAASAVTVVGDNERAAVYRFRKFMKIGGPGILITFPGVDKVKKIDLDEALPHWKGMSRRDIAEQLKHGVISAKRNGRADG